MHGPTHMNFIGLFCIFHYITVTSFKFVHNKSVNMYISGKETPFIDWLLKGRTAWAEVTGDVHIRLTLRRSLKHFCRAKARSVTYSECMPVASAIQHAKRVRHITLISVLYLSLLYLSTLRHKPHDFRKKFY